MSKSYDVAQWTIVIDHVPANDEWEGYFEELPEEGYVGKTIQELLMAMADTILANPEPAASYFKD